MPQSVYITLPGDVAQALLLLSLKEYRHPKQQAVALIAEGLRRAGALEGGEQGLADATRRPVGVTGGE